MGEDAEWKMAVCRESGVTSKNVSNRLPAIGQPWADSVAGEACARTNARALKEGIAAPRAASMKPAASALADDSRTSLRQSA